MKEKSGKLFLRCLRNEKGYSLIEFAITMGLVALVAGGVFAAYKFRVAPAAWATSKFDTFQSVDGGIETSKNSRGMAYPAQATAAAFTSVASLIPYIGSASTDINGWTYQCPSGSGQTMTIVINVADAPNTDAQNMLKDKVSNMLANSTVTLSGNNLTVSTANQNCN